MRLAFRDRLSLLAGNVLLSLLWLAFSGNFTLQSAAGGFLGGAAILGAFNRRYLKWLWDLIAFHFHLAWSILLASLQVMGQVLFRRRLEQGIIEYELTADSDIETLMIATAVTLTPGTISVDSRYGPDGKRYLYVHLLDGQAAEEFRVTLKHGFERRVYELARE